MDERLKVIIQDYGLDRSDVWELPQKRGTYCIKHAALEVVAAKAGITFDMPQIIEAHGGDGVAAVCVKGTLGNRSMWSIGECSPKNNKNAYPWAMAEKRAVDRVILKLIGIHGLVYSEDEMPPADADQPAPKAKAREPYAELQAELDACETLSDLQIFWSSPAFKAEFKKLPKDWQDQLTERKDELKDKLAAQAEASRPLAYVAPNFDGIQQ